MGEGLDPFVARCKREGDRLPLFNVERAVWYLLASCKYNGVAMSQFEDMVSIYLVMRDIGGDTYQKNRVVIDAYINVYQKLRGFTATGGRH